MIGVSCMAENLGCSPGFYEVERERSKRPSLVSTGRYSSLSSTATPILCVWTLQVRTLCKP